MDEVNPTIVFIQKNIPGAELYTPHFLEYAIWSARKFNPFNEIIVVASSLDVSLFKNIRFVDIEEYSNYYDNLINKIKITDGGDRYMVHYIAACHFRWHVLQAVCHKLNLKNIIQIEPDFITAGNYSSHINKHASSDQSTMYCINKWGAIYFPNINSVDEFCAASYKNLTNNDFSFTKESADFNDMTISSLLNEGRVIYAPERFSLNYSGSSGSFMGIHMQGLKSSFNDYIRELYAGE